MTDTHAPTENYRRFHRGTEVLELDRDYCQVMRRLNGGGWDCEECNWEGEAEEHFDERVEEALAAGWQEDDSAKTSLADAHRSRTGELPATYAAFLDAGRHIAADGFIVTGVPLYARSHRLLVVLDNLRIVHMDFCGLNPDDRYLPISTELRDESNPYGDPHPYFFAIDRQSPDAAVILASPGAITPAYPTFEAFVAALTAP